MPQPKLLQKPWASDGLKNDIPTVRTGSLAQEAATYTEGFPSITMTPIATGGKPPSGKDMNGVLNEISAHTVWQNQGGRYRFDQAYCTAIGGYTKGAVLINDAGDTEYVSLVDRNTINFNTTSDLAGKWAVFGGSGKADSQHKHAIEDITGLPNAIGNTVKLDGDQTVAGEKTYTDRVKLQGGVEVAESDSHYNGGRIAYISADDSGAFIRNERTKKSLSLAADGVLRYDGKAVLLNDVSRRDYSRTQTPPNPNYATEQYTTEGSVTVYPDGRIVQTFWIKNIQEQFFPADETGTGYQLHINDRSIPIALWTAMPNKVLSVSPQVLRGSNTSSSDAYYSEAAELPTAWALRKQNTNKNTVWLDMARIVGGSGNQRIDIFVVVEGY